MGIDRHGERPLGPLLGYHIIVQGPLDVGGLGDVAVRPALVLIGDFVEELVGIPYAFLADVNAVPSDQLQAVQFGLAAEDAAERLSFVFLDAHGFPPGPGGNPWADRKSTSLNSSH